MLHLGISAPAISVPGINYDEVIQAVPAADFLRGHARAQPLPQARSVDLFGRPFPWMTQHYMGALKGQLLIPSFAVFGATPEVLRLTTTLWTLLGVLLVMLWTQQVLGTRVSLVGGALLTLDPSLMFTARHDWGSFALALVARGAALCFATRWWHTRWPLDLGAAGLALGLGLYNKVDFGVFLVAAGVMLALCRPDAVRELLGRERRALVWGAAGLAVGLGPAILAAPGILRAASALASQENLAEKLLVARATLDGSYFPRLMAVGGRFGHMFEAEASRGLLAAAYLGSLGILLATWIGRGRLARAACFVAGTALLTQLGILLLPGAVRIHHALNIYPFPHLVVAIAALSLWDGSARLSRGKAAARLAVGVTVGLITAQELVITSRTLTFLEHSGGRGFWSDAIQRLARDVGKNPEADVISLDWGFQQPLLFLAEGERLIEPFRYLRQGFQRGRPWTHEGDEADVYLVHERDYDVFDVGSRFLGAVSRLDPDRVEIRPYLDREGKVAFLAVRLLGTHRVVHRGDFAIELR